MVTSAAIHMIQRQEFESCLATARAATTICLNYGSFSFPQVVSLPALLAAVRFAPNQMPQVLTTALFAAQFGAPEINPLVVATKKATKFTPSVSSGYRTPATAAARDSFPLEHCFRIAVAAWINKTGQFLEGRH